MKAIFEKPMSPWLAWAVTVVILSSGGIYCLTYSYLAQRPDGIGVGLSWALVSLVPWLFAFEIGKRVNYDPTGSWTANWWIIAAVLAMTAAVSVGLQDWLWADGQLSLRETAIAALKRFPPALAVSVLLFLFPMLQEKRESEVEAFARASDLPLLPQQIDWIRASGNYLEIKSGQRLILHRMTLASAERALKHHAFIRVHRSALINAQRVARHDRGKVADEVVLEDGTRLKVGASYRLLVEQAIGDRFACRQQG